MNESDRFPPSSPAGAKVEFFLRKFKFFYVRFFEKLYIRKIVLAKFFHIFIWIRRATSRNTKEGTNGELERFSVTLRCFYKRNSKGRFLGSKASIAR